MGQPKEAVNGSNNWASPEVLNGITMEKTEEARIMFLEAPSCEPSVKKEQDKAPENTRGERGGSLNERGKEGRSNGGRESPAGKSRGDEIGRRRANIRSGQDRVIKEGVQRARGRRS